jgi:dienelactone hydrolase
MLGLFFSITPWGRASVRGVLVLPGLVAARQLGPIVATGEPIRHVSLTVPSQGGTVYLDVWEPTTPLPLIPGTREGMLIIPGAGDNRTTAQLINLTESLAHADLVAMTMTTPALIAYRLTPLDGDAVVQAFLKLQHWPGVGANRVGILAFSAGSSLASLAAVDPRIAGSIAFLTYFGGFYNARDLFSDVGRRAQLVKGKLQPWTPDPVTLSVLANTTAGTLPSAEGAEISSAWDFHHPKLLSPAQVARLSAAARAAYHLLAGDESNQVQSNVDALTPAMQQLLQQLSPSSVAAQIRTPVYLLHDHSDTIVPFTESRDFTAALAALHHSYQFVEFSIFRHTEVRSTLDIGSLLHDGPHLFGIIYSATLPST